MKEKSEEEIFASAMFSKENLQPSPVDATATSHHEERGNGGAIVSRREEKEGRGNISTLIAFAPCRGMASRPRGASKRRPTLLPGSHGTPPLCGENPLLHKIQYPPGGAISSPGRERAAAIPESACAPYRRNSWRRGENSFAIEVRRLFSMRFDEPYDRKKAVSGGDKTFEWTDNAPRISRSLPITISL